MVPAGLPGAGRKRRSPPRPVPAPPPHNQVRNPKRTGIPVGEGFCSRSESRGGGVFLNLKRKQKVCVWKELADDTGREGGGLGSA